MLKVQGSVVGWRTVLKERWTAEKKNGCWGSKDIQERAWVRNSDAEGNKAIKWK